MPTAYKHNFRIANTCANCKFSTQNTNIMADTDWNCPNQEDHLPIHHVNICDKWKSEDE